MPTAPTPSAFIATLLLVAVTSPGCGNAGGGTGAGLCGAVNGKKPVGAQCAGATMEAAATCDGQVCIGLNANKQNRTGVCSKVCAASGDCGVKGVCLDDPLGDGTNYCARSCVTQADCCDGFVCSDQGNGLKICFVEPLVTKAVDCSKCLANTPQDLSSCRQSDTQVCDCPNGSPGATCMLIPNIANVYCCP